MRMAEGTPDGIGAQTEPSPSVGEGHVDFLAPGPRAGSTPALGHQVSEAKPE